MMNGIALDKDTWIFMIWITQEDGRTPGLSAYSQKNMFERFKLCLSLSHTAFLPRIACITTD
jgi:hypothetical protein